MKKALALVLVGGDVEDIGKLRFHGVSSVKMISISIKPQRRQNVNQFPCGLLRNTI